VGQNKLGKRGNLKNINTSPCNNYIDFVQLDVLVTIIIILKTTVEPKCSRLYKN